MAFTSTTSCTTWPISRSALRWDTVWRVRLAESRWSIAGFAIGLGWTGLSLHNDCRYKAFFQRLKSAKGSYRIDGGAGGRPQSPAPWPRRGRAALTWPAFKACEIHVITMALAGLGVLAIASPEAWLFLWQALVIVHGGARTAARNWPRRSLGERPSQPNPSSRAGSSRSKISREPRPGLAEHRPPRHGSRSGLTSAFSPRLFRTATTATIDTRRGQDAHARGVDQPAMTTKSHHRA